MEITMEHPIYLLFLLLLPLLVALHFYSLHYVRRRAIRFANFEALERVVQGRSVIPKNYLLLAMRMLVLVGFTLAAAGLTLHYDVNGVKYDYMIAMDSSSSMLANDLNPNRISAATQAVVDWAPSLPPGSVLGVSQFSSQATVLSPPTPDIQSAVAAVESVVVGNSGGTALCEALKASTNQLLATENPRAIILVSDGQNNAGCLLQEGIDYAKANNVTVFTIGVGSMTGGRIEGVPDIVFKLDETDLRAIASQTGGKFYRAETHQEISSALKDIAVSGKLHMEFPLAIPLMLFSFMLVFADWGLSITTYRTIP
jgi:Ca-activated chloride channel homolog